MKRTRSLVWGSRIVAIVGLPLLAFAIDRYAAGEFFATACGPVLCALYALGLIAYLGRSASANEARDRRRSLDSRSYATPIDRLLR